MALLYALWAAALFAWLAHGAVDASHTALLAARGVLAQAQAQALADGALALGVLELLAHDPARVPLGARSLALPGGAAVLTIEDEAGKVDLNRAPHAVLEGLFRAAASPDPAGLAAAVLARRARLGTETRPAFALPDALGQVPGVSAPLFARLAGSITTATSSETVDPGVAGPLALQAATGLGPAALAAFLAERARVGRFARPRGLAEDAPVGALTGAGFTLLAEARAEARAEGRAGDAVARRALVVKPVPVAGRAGLALIDWRRPASPPG